MSVQAIKNRITDLLKVCKDTKIDICLLRQSLAGCFNVVLTAKVKPVGN
jgi:hypothetical protein